MTPHQSRGRRLLLRFGVFVLLTTGAVAAAQAQGSTATLGEGGPREQARAGRQRPGNPPPEDEMAPKVKKEPLQRLEAGALLCNTEADLQQHEAAVQARLNGNEGAEPRGCHLVRAMMPISVVTRHGLNRTEVKSGDQHGWTDTMIRSP
jgi:hypothetical protein